MKTKYRVMTLLSITFISHFTLAQKKVLILKANNSSINIKEGDFLYKDIWNASSEVKLDTFFTNPFSGTKQVIFYSDIDSISFLVKPNKQYDFTILLNGKSPAYTQINTSLKAQPSLEPKLYYSTIKNKVNPDTIPFRLGSDSYIHLKGKVNGSDSLDFIFDTGAGICVMTRSLISKKVNMQLDGSQMNSGSDGAEAVPISKKNKLEIAHLVWNNVPFLSIDYKKFPFEAVLGWVAFEDKIVEIDYEKNRMIIHPILPKVADAYARVEMKLIGGIPYIKCKMVVNGKEIEAWFDFDSGSDGTLFIGQKLAADNGLNGTLESIGTSKIRGSSGKSIQQAKVLLPELKIGNFEMYQLPMSINSEDPKGSDNHENIGNNILKRFNTILDISNKAIYLKPNRLFYDAMKY
jgi:Aspartyl protease